MPKAALRWRALSGPNQASSGSGSGEIWAQTCGDPEMTTSAARAASGRRISLVHVFVLVVVVVVVVGGLLALLDLEAFELAAELLLDEIADGARRGFGLLPQ